MQTGGMGDWNLKLLKRVSSKQPVQNGERMRRKMRKGRVMMQDAEWKQGKRVCGEKHTGIGRGCRGPPQCSAVHEKTERRNKNRQHANSQQRDDRVKAYTARHHGVGVAAVSAVSGVWCGERRAAGWTGDRSKIMAGRHANWYWMNQKCGCFITKKGRWKWVEVGRHTLMFVQTETESQLNKRWARWSF